MVVISWLYPRAAHWTLDRNGIDGHAGATTLKAVGEEDEGEGEDEEQSAGEDKPRVSQQRDAPSRTIYCLDLRADASAQPFIEEVKRIAAEASTQTGRSDELGRRGTCGRAIGTLHPAHQ